jgi:hypothetical protein
LATTSPSTNNNDNNTTTTTTGYRAYSIQSVICGQRDGHVTSRRATVNVWTLQVDKIPLNQQVISAYNEKRALPIRVAVVGEDQHIINTIQERSLLFSIWPQLHRYTRQLDLEKREQTPYYCLDAADFDSLKCQLNLNMR